MTFGPLVDKRPAGATRVFGVVIEGGGDKVVSRAMAFLKSSIPPQIKVLGHVDRRLDGLRRIEVFGK